MFHGLRRSDQSCDEHFLVLDVGDDVVGLLDNPVDCRAINSLSLDAVHLEYLLPPFDGSWFHRDGFRNLAGDSNRLPSRSTPAASARSVFQRNRLPAADARTGHREFGDLY